MSSSSLWLDHNDVYAAGFPKVIAAALIMAVLSFIASKQSQYLFVCGCMCACVSACVWGGTCGHKGWLLLTFCHM